MVRADSQVRSQEELSISRTQFGRDPIHIFHELHAVHRWPYPRFSPILLFRLLPRGQREKSEGKRRVWDRVGGARDMVTIASPKQSVAIHQTMERILSQCLHKIVDGPAALRQ